MTVIKLEKCNSYSVHIYWYKKKNYYSLLTIIGIFYILKKERESLYLFFHKLSHVGDACDIIVSIKENGIVVYWPSTQPNMPFQSDAPEGSDTFQWPVIERNRVGGFGWWNGTR